MAKIAGVNIAQVVNSVAGPLLPVITLIKVTHGERDPANVTAGRPVVSVSHIGRGVVSKRVEDIGSGLDRTMLVATVLAESIDVKPEPGDRLEYDGVTYRLIGPVRIDPAGATYEIDAEV